MDGQPQGTAQKAQDSDGDGEDQGRLDQPDTRPVIGWRRIDGRILDVEWIRLVQGTAHSFPPLMIDARCVVASLGMLHETQMRDAVNIPSTKRHALCRPLEARYRRRRP